MPSKIIRGEDFSDPLPERPAPRPGRGAVVDSEVYDAHQQAKEIREQAERQAAQMLEKATQERDATVAAAQEMGREEGKAEATEIILRAKKEAAQIIQGAEPQAVKLALLIAEKLLGRALEADPELVLHVVAQAIESVRQQREIVLRVNPEDAQLLRGSRKKLMDMLGRTKDIAVRDDPEVARGGCIIETENGTVDAQLATQLQMLEEVLLGDTKKK
ncbi:MAG: type III secretion system stator protein SctL [Deltaproteobacteria bacterium]|nr:type III secretion system stator protein SctL [Deltaproteobacteria bacterium]